MGSMFACKTLGVEASRRGLLVGSTAVMNQVLIDIESWFRVHCRLSLW